MEPSKIQISIFPSSLNATDFPMAAHRKWLEIPILLWVISIQCWSHFIFKRYPKLKLWILLWWWLFFWVLTPVTDLATAAGPSSCIRLRRWLVAGASWRSTRGIGRYVIFTHIKNGYAIPPKVSQIQEDKTWNSKGCLMVTLAKGCLLETP